MGGYSLLAYEHDDSIFAFYAPLGLYSSFLFFLFLW